MKTARLLLLALSTVCRTSLLSAQHQHPTPKSDSSRMVGMADEAMSDMPSANARKHLVLSPTRKPTHEDSTKAWAVVRDLRSALAKYSDTSAAVADGYRMFMPNVKAQRVYHFTNYRNAFLEAFRFDVARPTSLLYATDSRGGLKLVGAMYSAPRRMRANRLDGRIPLSIARWHKHVNWCLPSREEADRWSERKEGAPVFGPESPIATRAECEDVGGQFHENLFGWMIHANVFAGDDLTTIFGHEH